jgi:hypothetical protein
MDFTYPFAFVEGMLVSFVVSLAVALTLKRIPKIPARIFMVAVACLVLATSVNWHAIGGLPLAFLAFDFTFIAAAAALGCVVGALPARLLLRVWRPQSPK